MSVTRIHFHGLRGTNSENEQTKTKQKIDYQEPLSW